MSVEELGFFLAESAKKRGRDNHKVDKYWKENFKKEINNALDSDKKEAFKELFEEKDINKCFKKLYENKLVTLEQVKDLYVEKQENSFKKVKVIHISNKESLSDLEAKIQTKYGADKFDKYNLCKNIELQTSVSGLNLVYINKINDNLYNIVYKYKVDWVELITTDGSAYWDPKSDITQAVLVIDKQNAVAQYRVTKHRGLSSRKSETDASVNSIDEVYKALQVALISLLDISEDDVKNFILNKNVCELFKDSILIKYEGEHYTEIEGGNVAVKFALDTTVKDLDYSSLSPYKELSGKLDNNILKIKGTWDNKNEKIKDIFIQSDRNTAFYVKTSEVEFLSSFNQKEMNYALSYLTKA